MKLDLDDAAFRERLVKGTVRITTLHDGPVVNAYVTALDKREDSTPVSTILRSAADEDDTLLEDWKLALQYWLERMRVRAIELERVRRDLRKV